MLSKKSVNLRHIDWGKYIVYIALVVMFLAFAIGLRERNFAGTTNILNILRQNSMVAVMAVAMTFVIATGNIDLSVGAVAAMGSVTSAMILQRTNSIPLAVLGALVIGVVIGCFNGYLTTKVGIPAFLGTLGTMYVVRGTAMLVTNTAGVPITNKVFCSIFGTGLLGGIPTIFVWTILFVIAGHILLKRTAFGKKVLATGGNESAARFTGINTAKIKFTTFVMSSTFAAFTGMMYASRAMTGRYSFSDGDEMSVIAAVVLGGTSMAGGTGSVIGALAGAILMGIINNALILAGLSISEQEIAKGVIIIIAVALSNLTNKKSR